MLHPQIVVFEREKRIATLLRELAAAERWALREPRQLENCREQLRQLTPTVFVVAVERPSDSALQLLQTATVECPHVAIVAVGSVEDAETLAVVRTALALPVDMSQADIDVQAAMITKRLNIADLKDPQKVDKFLARFSALYDLTTGGSTATGASIILGGGGSGVGTNTSLLSSLQSVALGRL